MRILITGFEPYGSRNINLSWEVAKTFKDVENISVMQLPVSFSKAHVLLIEEITREDYDIIIMLGETPATNDVIKLERVAINLKDSKSSDNDGEIAEEQPLQEEGPAAFFSNFPLKKLWVNLCKKNTKIKISNSAGTYVCNSLYYNILKHITEYNLSTKALFIHLPSSDEVIDKKEMRDVISQIIKLCESL